MSIVLLTTYAKRTDFRAVPILDEDLFIRRWHPLCQKLKLRLLSQAFPGIKISRSDLPVLRDEFLKLRDHVKRMWLPRPQHIRETIPAMCERALVELAVSEGDCTGTLFLASSFRSQEVAGIKGFDVSTLRPLDEPVDFSAQILPIFSFTSSSFQWSQVFQTCSGFGWELEFGNAKEGWGRFIIGNQFALTAESGRTTGRAFAFMIVHFHNEFDYRFDPTLHGGREQFDHAYERCNRMVEVVLGPPTAAGQYQYSHREGWPYHYAIWPGEAGVLILRQDELDIQFGMDINLWAEPWQKGQPLPEMPIVF